MENQSLYTVAISKLPIGATLYVTTSDNHEPMKCTLLTTCTNISSYPRDEKTCILRAENGEYLVCSYRRRVGIKNMKLINQSIQFNNSSMDEVKLIENNFSLIEKRGYAQYSKTLKGGNILQVVFNDADSEAESYWSYFLYDSNESLKSFGYIHSIVDINRALENLNINYRIK